MMGITHVLNTAEGSRFGQVDTGHGYYRDMTTLRYEMSMILNIAINSRVPPPDKKLNKLNFFSFTDIWDSLSLISQAQTFRDIFILHQSSLKMA